jgi:hypothetical protein
MEGGAIRSGRVISKLESQKCEVKAQRGACTIANKVYIRLHECEYMHVSQETAMNIKQTTLAAAFALAAIGPAHAEGLKPLHGQVIDLCDVSGVAYYTVERDGFRVVATLAKKDEDALPVRVVGRARPRPKPDVVHPA